MAGQSLQLAEPLMPVFSGRIESPSSELERLWKIALGNLRESSRRAYRARLLQITQWLGISLDVLPLLIIQSDTARFHAWVFEYREYLEHSRLSPATCNLTLAALTRVVGSLHQRQLITWTLSVRGFKAQRFRDTDGPTEAVVQQLICEARKNTLHPDRGARDEAIIRLAVSLGLRRSEVVMLDISDVQTTSVGVMFVDVQEKGSDEPRRMKVPRIAARAVAAWLTARAAFADDPDEPAPLFIRLTHTARKQRRAQRLTDEGMAHVLQRLQRRAGVADRVRPHGLRHRAITSFLEAGGTLVDAVAFARHTDPKTTMIYVDNLKKAAERAAEIVDGLFGE